MVYSRAKIKKIVSDFIKRVQRKNIPIDQVYLFGSYAWGKPTPTSDIDIAVVSPKFERLTDIRRIEILSDIARYVYSDIDVEIDAVGFAPKDMEKASYFDLAAEIRQKGQVVFKKTI